MRERRKIYLYRSHCTRNNAQYMSRMPTKIWWRIRVFNKLLRGEIAGFSW